MTYRLSELAGADLDGILDYTWSHYGEAQAARYYGELRDTMALIADTPMVARERTEFSPPVRIHPHGQHLIVYRTQGSAILVIRVLHQAMDIDSAL